MKPLKDETVHNNSILHSSRIRLLAALLFALCAFSPAFAQQLTVVSPTAASLTATRSNDAGNSKDANKKSEDKTVRKDAAEIEQMRSQLQQAQQRIEEMQRQMDEMRAMLKQIAATSNASRENNSVVAATGVTRANSSASPDATTAPGETIVAVEPAQDKTQQQPTIDKLIKPVSEGGQFHGSEGLLKTDRVKVGGYMDFRFVTRGIDDGNEIRNNIAEANSGNILNTNFKRTSFTSPRLVVGIAAALTDKLLFNSEIEFEFGGKETEIEQAYLEYRFHRMFNLRGGIITPPLGRFNLFHDSNLQDIAPRPLSGTFITPSTYKDAGMGAFGEFRLGSRMRLSYEGYVTNGLRSDEGGGIAREAGIFESKGNNRFFDNNKSKATVGRMVFSPTLGVELGLSGYRGKHDNKDLYNLSVWAVDWRYAWRGLQVLGQYARTALQRAPESPEELEAREFLLSLKPGSYSGTADDLNELLDPLFGSAARSSDGWYTEARYRFRPHWLVAHAAEDASIAPVFRYDQINLDRQFPNFRFPLNVRRTSFGFSLRPTEAASLNLTYHFDQKPDLFFTLTDGRPLPPLFTNAGNKRGLSLGLTWAF